MGGSGGKVTVGYKYYLGMHIAICHSGIDALTRIKVDNRIAWEGYASSGTITIAKEGLFGGEDREGGISGFVDLEPGDSTQTQNTYLQSRLGTDIPAFRGVFCAVLKQVYLGLSPYLKLWSFRVQRIHKTSSNNDQWYSEKAAIGLSANTAMYLAVDVSGSMTTISSNGLTRLANLKSALVSALTPLTGLPDNSTVDITVVAFGGTSDQILKRNANGSDVQDIITWVEAHGTIPGTSFDVAVDAAPAFFEGAGDKTRRLFFITDGIVIDGSEVAAGGIIDSIDSLTSSAFNIDESDTTDTTYVDNTPSAGVPVIDGGDTTALANAITRAIFFHLDMNPAHIIRECLTDPAWGMGYLASDIDDTTFEAAADTLYTEAMGISLLWDRQIQIEEFVQEIVRHINATLFINPLNGKFTLKLIRNDYDEESLLELNETNISKVTDYSRVDIGEAVNSVTVVYWDGNTEENASITADNIGLIQQTGSVINTTIQYPGFTNARLAGLAAGRDLKTFSTPLLSVTLETNREAATLSIGDTFKFVWADYHSGYVLMRVHKVSFGNGKTNHIKIVASEDIFALPQTLLVNSEINGWEEPVSAPIPSPYRSFEEISYYEWCRAQGQKAVDELLVDDPTTGFVVGGLARVEGGINARLWINSGGGYDEAAIMDYCPYGLLAADLTPYAESATLTSYEDLEVIRIGSFAKINDEYLRIDSVNTSTGEITFGRAALDTVPSEHPENGVVLFIQDYYESDEVPYVEAESIDAKMATTSGLGSMALSDAPVDNVVLDSRAIKPYPPGNFQINGSYYPEAIVGSLSFSWAHRDRTQQTGSALEDFKDSSIGPESNTTYSISVYGDSDALIATETGITGTSHNLVSEGASFAIGGEVEQPDSDYSTVATAQDTQADKGMNHQRTWWNSYQSRWDGVIRALAGDSTSDGYIYKDLTGTPADTGVPVATRNRDRIDTYWDDTNKLLYVVKIHATEVYLSTFSYNSGSDTYTAGTHVDTVVTDMDTSNDLNNGSFGVDSLGQLWCCKMTNAGLFVTRSTDGGSTWYGTPVTLDGTVLVGTCDISFFTYSGDDYVLVMGAEDTAGSAVAYSIDISSNDATVQNTANWTTETLPSLDGSSASDNHLAIHRGSDEKLYCIMKCEGGTTGDPEIVLFIRQPAGSWAVYNVTEIGDPEVTGSNPSRPTVITDSTNIYCLFTDVASSQEVWFKRALLNSPGSLLASSFETLMSDNAYSNPVVPIAPNPAGEMIVLAHTLTGDYRSFVTPFGFYPSGLNYEYRVTLKSVRDGYDSFQEHNYSFVRAGYGLQYGNFYGGV